MARTTTDAGRKPDDVLTPFRTSRSNTRSSTRGTALPAELLDLAADCLDDRGEAIAAQMRAVVIENARFVGLLALAFREQLEHPHHVRTRAQVSFPPETFLPSPKR